VSGAATPSPEWLRTQRWFGAKGSAPTIAGAADTTLGEDLVVSVVDVGDARYQLVRRPDDDQPDSLTDPVTGGALGRAMADGRRADGPCGTIAFERPAGAKPWPAGPVRPLGAEQSNTSVVVGDQIVVKVFRRIERGENPELEMLRFLGAQGFDRVPGIEGWATLTAPEGEVATLAIAQELVHDGRDGWELVLERLEADDRGASVVPLLHDLGTTLAGLHRALGADREDPDFAPEPGGRELAAALAERIAADAADVLPRVALLLGGSGEGDGAEPAVTAEAVAAAARGLADRLDAGPVLRHHGDLHLGQTLHTPGGWVILDFEGEPARPLAERRVKQPALRDVAGMLRSLSYAAATRARSGPWTPGWEAAARAALLDGYLAGADRALLPAPGTPTGRLLTLLELEKALYELRYELGNRPDWVHLPLAGLRRIVDPNRSPR
jgi:trehalose synthase-fused probable maltokinase